MDSVLINNFKTAIFVYFQALFLVFITSGRITAIKQPPMWHIGSNCKHVSQADPGSDADKANGSHRPTSVTHCQNTRHMLNTAANVSSASVALLFSDCQLPVPISLALKVFTNNLFLERAHRILGSISGPPVLSVREGRLL